MYEESFPYISWLIEKKIVQNATYSFTVSIHANSFIIYSIYSIARTLIILKM